MIAREIKLVIKLNNIVIVASTIWSLCFMV